MNHVGRRAHIVYIVVHDHGEQVEHFHIHGKVGIHIVRSVRNATGLEVLLGHLKVVFEYVVAVAFLRPKEAGRIRGRENRENQERHEQ